MNRRARILAALLALATLAPLAAQAPKVSEKQDVAIFALGYYGWNIPLETLGSIDLEIQKVFVDLGRFNVIGVTQRLSSGGLDQFIATIKKAKESSFVMPDKYQFGEAVLTEAEFNKLVGAFIVAAPVVSGFNSSYNSKSAVWETEIKTNVTFIDVSAGGSVVAIAEISTSGSDKQNQLKSISDAIEGIPNQLQFEIRKIPAFQINTRILALSGGEVKLQLGQNMGIQKGDEYAVISGGMVEGFREEREAGLILIKEVGAEVSTGLVIYSDEKLGKNSQLREIPRLGVDAEPFLHIVGGAAVPGVKAVVSRGFFGFRPYAAIQVPLAQISTYFTAAFIPVCAVVGGTYDLHLGRLTLSPYGGIGASYIYFIEALSDTTRDTQYFPHVGLQAYASLSYLLNRDMRVFAEAGFEYWLSISPFFDNYGGLSFGAGASFKL